MKNIGSVWVTGTLASLVALGCGGGGNKGAETPSDKGGGAVVNGVTTRVDEGALKKFNAALDALNGHDKTNDWNDQTCADTAKMFEVAASAQGKFPEATYDAGLAYQRCGNDKEAKAHFDKALADEPKFHFARAQLALYQFKADANVDGAISALETAVNDANFQKDRK